MVVRNPMECRKCEDLICKEYIELWYHQFKKMDNKHHDLCAERKLSTSKLINI